MSGSVGIGGNEDHTRVNKTVVDHNLMTDPGADVEEEIDTLIPTELSHKFLVFRLLNA